MKNVFIFVNNEVSRIDAEKYMLSLGYKWKYVKSSSEFSQSSLTTLKGFSGNSDGELCWFDNHFYSENNRTIDWEEIFLPTNKHKHYDLIIQWAKDPSQKVWYLNPSGCWREATTPTWNLDFTYHIGEQPPPPKRKIMIGDIEIDAPEVNPPKEYYVPMITEIKLHVKYIWNGDTHDLLWLKRGLIHLSPEAAIEHAKALIKVSTTTSPE